MPFFDITKRRTINLYFIVSNGTNFFKRYNGTLEDGLYSTLGALA